MKVRAMNYKQCAKTLLGHENILILTHKNPDGDTAASAAAAAGRGSPADSGIFRSLPFSRLSGT